MITFTCKGKGCSPSQWEGSLEILKRGNPCEAELCARGSHFHLIVGRHSYGNYLCIPNWEVGTELSSLTDVFWNEERLRHYSRMKKADIRPITRYNLMTDILAISCQHDRAKS